MKVPTARRAELRAEVEVFVVRQAALKANRPIQRCRCVKAQCPNIVALGVLAEIVVAPIAVKTARKRLRSNRAQPVEPATDF